MPVIEERVTVSASLSRVWEFLLDPHKVGECVPGCTSVEVLTSTVYEIRMNQRIGPISASFKVRGEVLKQDPPNRMLCRFTGQDSRTQSLLTVNASIDLRKVAETDTEVVIVSEINLSGVLGKFGNSVFKQISKKQTAQFAQNLSERLRGEGTVRDLEAVSQIPEG